MWIMASVAVMAKKRRRAFGTVVRLPSGRYRARYFYQGAFHNAPETYRGWPTPTLGAGMREGGLSRLGFHDLRRNNATILHDEGNPNRGEGGAGAPPTQAIEHDPRHVYPGHPPATSGGCRSCLQEDTRGPAFRWGLDSRACGTFFSMNSQSRTEGPSARPFGRVPSALRKRGWRRRPRRSILLSRSHRIRRRTGDSDREQTAGRALHCTLAA